MARNERAIPILNAASTWKKRCLSGDGSVFSDGQLWTKRNLAELDRCFVQNLMLGSGGFFDKLEVQLEPASPATKKLAAEMLWVMYLLVSESAMGAETKRFQIRQVWAWSGEEIPEDHPMLGDVLAKGVSHPGTAYNTHRWREFSFFITMMEEWKELSSERRARLLSHPWEYAEWLKERKQVTGRQLRHIVLFLLFPEAFERIATGSHKQLVVREFRKKWGEDTNGVDYDDWVAVDRDVLRVRERLADSLNADPQTIDFYADGIQEEWRPARRVDDGSKGITAWPDDAEAESWLRHKFGDSRVWLMATGGGGRLWRDFRETGMVAIDFQYLGDMTEYGSREAVHAAIADKDGRENPFNDSLAAWQFVREMKKGDVVIAKQGRSRIFGWGLVRGDYAYEPERSEYQHIREVEWKATGQWDLVGDQRGISSKTLTEFRQYPSWTKWALALMGGDGGEPGPGGKSEGYTHRQALKGLFLDSEEFTAILDSLGRRCNVILQGPPGVGKTFIARRLAWALIGRKEPGRIQLVQFHQSYSYEDFVQGWRPNEQGGFVLRDGVFRRFCQRAAEDPAKEPFVFVIDEINRGNLSRILGELMMLIESDKRGPAHAIPLTYSADETFYVPENVHVLGLMNTADRSLAMVDYALRRRFGFIDLAPAFGKERFTQYLLEQEVPEAIVSRINSRMGALNDAIREDRRNLGPGYEIGHSFFVPSGDEENLDETWYRAVITTEIAPLLREYWFDQPELVDNHVGRLLA